MSGVLERLRKKRGFPVEIDGETYYVRSLTIGELRRHDALAAEAKAAEQGGDTSKADNRSGFLIGCALCSDASGVQEIPKLPDEPDSAWAVRVLEAMSDVPTETIRALCDGVAKIGVTPKLDTAIKN